jgi:hypothetical protein
VFRLWISFLQPDFRLLSRELGIGLIRSPGLSTRSGFSPAGLARLARSFCRPHLSLCRARGSVPAAFVGSLLFFKHRINIDTHISITMSIYMHTLIL